MGTELGVGGSQERPDGKNLRAARNKTSLSPGASTCPLLLGVEPQLPKSWVARASVGRVTAPQDTCIKKAWESPLYQKRTDFYPGD